MSDALNCPTCNTPTLVCISREEGIDWAPAYPHHICERCGNTWVECKDDKGPYFVTVTAATSKLIGLVASEKLILLTILYVQNRFRARHTPRAI